MCIKDDVLHSALIAKVKTCQRAAVFILVKQCKQPRCPPAVDEKNQWWYTLNIYTAIQNIKLLIHTATRCQQTCGGKEVRPKKGHTVWQYSNEVQKQTKLINDDRSQERGCTRILKVFAGEGHKKAFQSAGNSLYLDFFGGYLGLYLRENTCT